ncbi:hypothetical protein BDR03DRAFT_503365 [Suillus americanus]|nr:hypothetical protein BDR03DRAFT_503365 [Suillus americanus]
MKAAVPASLQQRGLDWMLSSLLTSINSQAPSPVACTDPKRITGIILNSHSSRRTHRLGTRHTHHRRQPTLSMHPPHSLTPRPPSHIHFYTKKVGTTFTCYLHRILDALPSGGQKPKTGNSTIHIISDKVQKSNIVAVSMCPGLCRSDVIAPLLNAVRGRDQSTFGIILIRIPRY